MKRKRFLSAGSHKTNKGDIQVHKVAVEYALCLLGRGSQQQLPQLEFTRAQMSETQYLLAKKKKKILFVLLYLDLSLNFRTGNLIWSEAS